MARGRARKQNNLPLNISTDPNIEPSTPTEAKTHKKTVTRVEKWSEDVPSQEAQQQNGLFEEEIDLELDEERHPFDLVLEDFGGDQANDGYIKVYRLPDYHKRGIASPRNAVREWCEDIPATPEYLTLIKETWGPGVYQLELRNKIGFLRRKTVSIAAPAVPMLQRIPGSSGSHNPLSAGVVTAAPGIPIEMPDPTKVLDDTIDRMAKISKLFGIQFNQQTQQPQLQQAQPQDDTDPILKSFVTVAMADEKMRDRAVSALGGLLKGNNTTHEVTFMDIALEAVKQFPNMIKAAKDLILEVKTGVGVNGSPQMAAQTFQTNQAGMGSPPGWNQAQTQNGSGQTIPQESTALQTIDASSPGTPTPVSGIDEGSQVLSFVLIELLKAMQRNEHMIPVVNFLIKEESKHPDMITPLINDLMDQSPDAILTTMGAIPEAAQYTSLPHAREWIQKLQTAIKDSTEPGPEEGDQPNG